MALSEKSAEAAYILADAFNELEQPDETMQEEEQESSENEDVVFDWEEKLIDLPKDFEVLWNRYGTGGARFDTKSLLEKAPAFAGLPCRALENNLLGKADQASNLGRLDRQLKVVQQFLLHSLRVQTHLGKVLDALVDDVGRGDPHAARGLLQQLWAFTAVQYHKLADDLPGSSSPDQVEVKW